MYNVIWYNGFNFQTDINESMLINTGNKKINSKSRPFINIGSGFDCETSQFARHENLTPLSQEYKNALHSYVYIWQFSVGTDIYLCRNIDLFESFILQLDKACAVHPNAKLIIWDANLKFEWSFFKYILKKYVTRIFAKSKNDVITVDILSHLQFRECLGAFGNSLDAIAKNHCTTQKLKGDLDYDLIRTPETPLTEQELQYCINDVAILSELTEYAHSEYTLKGDKIPLTQTGIVRNAIKKNYCATDFQQKKLYAENKPLIGTKSQYNEYRKYVYSGGLTHSNFKYVGKIINDVHCYDLTSAYPWALNTQNYPSGDMITTENPDEFKNAFSHKHWFMKITVKDVQSKSTHSTVSIHKVLNAVNPVIDNGRIYSADYITAYFTEIDWLNFKAIYTFSKQSQIHSVTYFTKSTRVPKQILEVMNDWYKKKTIIKQRGTHDGKDKKIYKRLKQLINSVYGMTVTALFEMSHEWSDELEEIAESINEWDTVSNTVFNPWFGYYCTAYVRARLIEMISRFPDSIVQYDTDSIYCLPNADLDKYIEMVNARTRASCIKTIKEQECWDLGEWDNDGDYTRFICLGSKRYVGEHPDGTVKITFAGANADDMIKFAKEQNMDILEYSKSFNIEENISNKKGAFHFSDTYSEVVTDYMGNTYYCTTHGGTTVKTVPFKASLSHMFEILQKAYA